jgi:hypothetical protein
LERAVPCEQAQPKPSAAILHLQALKVLVVVVAGLAQLLLLMADLVAARLDLRRQVMATRHRHLQRKAAMEVRA